MNSYGMKYKINDGEGNINDVALKELEYEGEHDAQEYTHLLISQLIRQ
jgi:hypothetical protein